MSVEAMALVLHHSQAEGTAKVVLLGIANHDGDGGAWPSIATLAKYAHKSERQVQYVIRQLVHLGEIVVHERQGGTIDTPTDKRTNRYEILLRCPPECDGSTNHRVAGCNPARGEVKPTAPREVKPTAPEPSPEPPINLPAPSLPLGALDDEFEQWWKGYPNKKGKAKARESFRARRREGTPFAALLQARDNYLDECRRKRTKPEYVKHGSTFLHGKDGPWSEYMKGSPDEYVEDYGPTQQQQLAAAQWGSGR